MKIRNQAVVHLHYVMTLADGQEIDRVNEENPFLFIYGSNQVFDALEKQLEGLEEGDSFDFDLEPADSYGDYDPQLIREVTRESLKDAPAEYLEVGKTLPMLDSEGNTIFGVITAIDEEKASLDFNHPLAGNTIHFTGLVVEVREATKTELELGKVMDN